MLRQELTELTSELISYQTLVTKSPEVDRCFTFIRNYFRNTGLYIERFESNGVPSLLVATANSKRPRLLLSGHIDVVKARPEQYRARLDGNKLYGRGAIDMKGSVAVMMRIMKQMQDVDGIAALFTSDEEVGGTNGMRYVLSQGLRPAFTIIAEESDFNISVRQKGGLILEVTAKGKKAHSAIPEQGDNAIDKLLNVYDQLRKSLKSARSFRPTVNLGTISGGISPQFVPDAARATFDIRVTNQREYDCVKKLISSINKLPDYQVGVVTDISFMQAGSCEAEIMKLEQATKDVTGVIPRRTMTPYASDGRYLTELGLPVVEFGPAGEGFHGDEEYVDIARLAQYYQVLEKFIIGLK